MNARAASPPADVAELLERGRSIAAGPDAAAARLDHERAVARVSATEHTLERRLALDRLDVPLPDDVLELVAGEQLEERAAIRAVRAWLLGPRPVLVLLGPSGCGKTTAAAQVLAERHARGPSVYVRESALVEAHARGRLGRAWREAMTATTLVVDQLGAMPESAGELARLAHLDALDARLGRGRRTLLAGALTRAELEARVHHQTRSRLEWVASIVELGAA